MAMTMASDVPRPARLHLCEARRVGLRPGQMYIFVPSSMCTECCRLLAEAEASYGREEIQARIVEGEALYRSQNPDPDEDD